MTTTTVEPGTIFASSWGYDETRVDFYQVVALTPSGKSVKLRKIAARTDQDKGVKFPRPGEFLDNAPTITKRLNVGWNGDVNVRFTKYAWGYPYDVEADGGMYDSAAAGWQR